MNDEISTSQTQVADGEDDSKLVPELSMPADDQIVWLGIIVGVVMLFGSIIWGAVEFLF